MLDGAFSPKRLCSVLLQECCWILPSHWLESVACPWCYGLHSNSSFTGTCSEDDLWRKEQEERNTLLCYGKLIVFWTLAVAPPANHRWLISCKSMTPISKYLIFHLVLSGPRIKCPDGNFSTAGGKNFLCCISDVSFRLFSFTKGMGGERKKERYRSERASEWEKERESVSGMDRNGLTMNRQACSSFC